MSNTLVALSTWLHSLATIVMIGYFVFTSLIFLPVLARQLSPDALRGLLEHISARLKPYFAGSVLIFLVTGTHLMLVNDAYMGLGDIFANSWSILIVVKHVLVLAFLALAALSERAYLGKISASDPRPLAQFRLALGVNLVLGLAILLLTALAQAG